MRKGIRETLMERDGISAEEADDLIAEAIEDFQECLLNGEIDEAENICVIHFGLEPDYLDDLEGLL